MTSINKTLRNLINVTLYTTHIRVKEITHHAVMKIRVYELRQTNEGQEKRIFLKVHTIFYAVFCSNRPPYWIENDILHLSSD